MPVKTTIEFLAALLSSADMGGSRNRLDMFADRLVKAASEPTLPLAMEALLRGANVGAIHPPLATRMLACASGEDGPRILRWWREQAKLVTMLAATRDAAVVEQAVAAIALPEAAQSGAAASRGAYPIAITAQCETPLAHGADTKAGNATLFRRMQVLTDQGSLFLPYYSGNALRGQMRDLLADHFLAALGLDARARGGRGSLAMWFFYALYSGGALEEASEAVKAVRGRLGDHGAVRAAGVREFRDRLPALSLLGCALGNRVLPGRCQIADLRPVCREWGTGDRPVAELMTWLFLTRREDDEDHADNHSMIADTEVLRAGVRLEGGADYDQAILGIERAALGRGLDLLVKRGHLGAENRRGLGRVAMVVDGLPDPAPYDEFLSAHRADILAYLGDIGALSSEAEAGSA